MRTLTCRVSGLLLLRRLVTGGATKTLTASGFAARAHPYGIRLKKAYFHIRKEAQSIVEKGRRCSTQAITAELLRQPI